MGKKIKVGKKLTALIIAILVFAVITGMHLLGVFHFLEYKSYDFRVKFWAQTSFNRPHDDIVLVLLDESSLKWAQKERGWGWPWPRQAYAEIVDFMKLAGAKSVAFDFIFSEPSIYLDAEQNTIISTAAKRLEEAEEAGFFNMPAASAQRRENRSPGDSSGSSGGQSRRETVSFIVDTLRKLSAGADDLSFVDASADYGHVVQTVVLSTTETTESWPSGLDKPLFQPDGSFGPMLEKFRVTDEIKGKFPIAKLAEAAGAIGCVTGTADSDGIFRRLKPFFIFDDKAIPSFSAATLLVSGQGQEISYNEKTGSVEWEGITIPVDNNGNALLRYRGEIDKYRPERAFVVLLSLDTIQNGENSVRLNDPELDVYLDFDISDYMDIFKDRYIFFGVHAQGLFDFFPTPISSTYPGVGGHMTMLDNMLMGDFIRESSELSNLLILLIVIIAIVLLTMFSHRIPLTIGGTIAAIVAVIIGSVVSYQFGGIWVPMVTYLAGILAAFITVTLYNFATEGSQKRFIKSAFSQYLSPKVIEQIIQDPSQLKLGGEKREMTAIFTDVRGFSTFSEALGDPTKLVELLNFYLTRMSNIVLDNQGTIDKYEGDAIIAFFGAPIHFNNHAALACRAAINMKKAEPEINRDAIESGLVNRAVMEAMLKKGLTKSVDDPCQIFTRIGMNTGDMVVGNMGTPNKMDYTIMGNAVNLAARLEGVNKQYNTGGILISEYTRAHLGDEFVLRPLSRVRVVGINTPLRLYELLDTAAEASSALCEMVKNWEQAFALYEKKDFPAAKNIFETICRNNENDMAAKKYLDRCVKYISAPPDEKTWDNGVDNLTEK
jgi:class 3 adenylate cyclase/CHASE2 domain-containing sensor protein